MIILLLLQVTQSNTHARTHTICGHSSEQVDYIRKIDANYHKFHQIGACFYFEKKKRIEKYFFRGSLMKFINLFLWENKSDIRKNELLLHFRDHIIILDAICL